ncbi:PAS domain-containing protein [Hymenobacter siberiensis]|uniref:PAS domain-containing protein n=1 Tax=Hymenobacter siberiensis TaxID=2848396 RepID=UPI001C1DD927|nr:PAS domain-containing protein [Hymenobacter siberiensis]MBU6123365.1 PAS domain-containing sensor histidine kinase [Hymenobacter siberiensis]
MSQKTTPAAPSDTPAETTGQPQQLAALLRDSPTGLASLAGPAHQVTVTNELFRQLFDKRPLAGLRLSEALPELADQSFFALLDEAYRTGTTCFGHEAVAFQSATQPAPGGPVYFTFIAQAVRDAAGAVSGLLLFAYNVSTHMRARQPAGSAPPASTAQQLAMANEQLAVANEELDVTNEELHVSNEELQVSNHQLLTANEALRTQADELRQSQQAVELLNNELTLTNAGLVDTIIDSLQATEAARAEAEAQRQRLHRLVAEAPAMIAVLTGPDHVVELANDDYRAMVGHRELVGRPFRQALPELEGQPFFDQLDEVYRTGETYTDTDVPVTLDRTHSGQLEHLFATYILQATRDGAGQITGILIFAYEVTELVRARQEREDIARQRQLVTDALPALISYVDQDRRYQFTNQAYEGWFQQSSAQLRGQRVRDVVGEPSYAAAAPYMARALAGERVDFEARMPYRNDLIKHIRTSFVPDVQQEQVVGFYCLITDITEQVTARAEVERQQRQQHELFMAAPGPIAILAGPDLVFELVNPAYQQVFPGRELFGKSLLDVLPELANTEIPGLCHQVYATGETYVAEELPLQLARHTDGPLEEAYWTFTYQARRNAQDVIDGVVVFAYDVSSQVRARQQVQTLNQQLTTHNTDLDDTNQQLVRTNVDLDSFVYTASHDLQGPLNNLDGLLQALRQELPGTERSVPVAHLLELLHDSVERFQHTLTHLSAIARTQAEAGPQAPLVPLADVVRDVLLDLALPIAEAGAQVSVDIADCPAVRLAEKHLRSVVYNLLSNAVKYRHPDRVPQVRVQCRTEEHRWALEVQDNGLGLALPPGRPVFGLFQRFHTHVDGSGVGLYMAQKLVENEGGALEVVSQVGEGSTFTVYLPR